MNKMEYQKPWAEFVQFSNEDVITASGEEPPKPSGGEHDTHGHYPGRCGSWFFGIFWICETGPQYGRNTFNEDWGIDAESPYSAANVDPDQWLGD